MLHRALLGSFERFIGILIEQHEGKMPLWLAPNQVRIINITDKQRDFCLNLEKTLMDQGFRVHTDLRESGKVSVRTRDARELGPMDLDTLISGLNTEVASCGRDPLKDD